MEINITINVENKMTDVEEVHVSQYAVWFDETCAGWTKDPETNKLFLLRQQEYANEKLKAKGYLFLNEVLDMLGIPITKAGQVVGWIFDENNTVGDNFVDFGLLAEHNKGFINGYEKSVLLDFNPDGCILDRI